MSKKALKALAGPGTYAVLLAARAAASVHVGALGPLSLRPGMLIYVGSALGRGGLLARLSHHWRRCDRPHWHIDYVRRHTVLEAAWVCPGPTRHEHVWATACGAVAGASVPVVGFGASDCGCTSHLFSFAACPSAVVVRRCLRRAAGGAPVKYLDARLLASLV